MKKGKIFASLCAGALLLSAAPSLAEKPEQKIVLEMPRVLTFEQKIERIADYLEEADKVQSFNLQSTAYGLNPVTLRYIPEDDGIALYVYKRGMDVKGALNVLLSKPEFVMFDAKNNKYGNVDYVYKKNGEEYGVVGLTDEERNKFNGVYKKIIEKFYSENKDEMDELEKALEQDKVMGDLFKILEKNETGNRL